MDSCTVFNFGWPTGFSWGACQGCPDLRCLCIQCWVRLHYASIGRSSHTLPLCLRNSMLSVEIAHVDVVGLLWEDVSGISRLVERLCLSICEFASSPTPARRDPPITRPTIVHTECPKDRKPIPEQSPFASMYTNSASPCGQPVNCSKSSLQIAQDLMTRDATRRENVPVCRAGMTQSTRAKF